MLDRLLTAMVYEILSCISKNSELFADNNVKDKALASAHGLPAQVKTYLESVPEGQFFADLTTITQVIHSGVASLSMKDKDNALLKAVAQFLVKNFAKKLDSIPLDYYRLSKSDQRKKVEEMVKSDGFIGQSLKDLLVDYSLQELNQGLADFIRQITNSSYILVQSPREISKETKEDIRMQLYQKFGESSFPVFQINKNLIGGLRVFVDGKVADHSWLGRINYLTSITYSV